MVMRKHQRYFPVFAPDGAAVTKRHELSRTVTKRPVTKRHEPSCCVITSAHVHLEAITPPALQPGDCERSRLPHTRARACHMVSNPQASRCCRTS
jgi:hypothetical protein